MTTNAQKLYTEARQACLGLDLKPTLGSARRLIKSGSSSIRGMKNYYQRREVMNISHKPYTNEFGEQEEFGSICDRNLPYAEKFVQKNLSKFEGGVRNMTEASIFVMRKQREQLNELLSKSN